jgi:bifunctional oligoribonuclease and PAP phosphatase NrnA
MIGPRDFDNVRTWLANCRQPLLITHRRPDGDALGALAALGRALGQLHVTPLIALYEPLPPRYGLLAELAAWQQWQEPAAALAERADALVIVDTCAYAQLEPVRTYLEHAPRTLVIDHHPTRDAIGTRPGDLRLIDESAGAVCVLIGEWLQACGLALDPAIATALLVGVGTDTGWFRFSNTDGRALRLAADLAAAGAPPNAIYRYIYEQDAAARLRLIGQMLLHMELLAEGRLAVLRLRRSDFAAAGADGAVTDDLVNEAGRLAGLEATLLFLEEPDGSVRVNFRSKQTLDVAVLAQRFGGGGHARAAGARPPGTFDEVVARVVDATLRALPAGVPAA